MNDATNRAEFGHQIPIIIQAYSIDMTIVDSDRCIIKINTLVQCSICSCVRWSDHSRTRGFFAHSNFHHFYCVSTEIGEHFRFVFTDWVRGASVSFSIRFIERMNGMRMSNFSFLSQGQWNECEKCVRIGLYNNRCDSDFGVSCFFFSSTSSPFLSLSTAYQFGFFFVFINSST